MKRSWFVLALIAAYAAPGAAAPAIEPLLKIETGQHIQGIERVSVDAAGKWLVTSSRDRTARLWDLATGRVVRTFRVHQGPADDGSIYVAAISPDARVVVISALASVNTLFVVDRATGRLLKRLPELPALAGGLAFSPDGKRLAALLAKGGVRVYDTKSWTLAYADATCPAAVFGADFNRAGELVTACQDGVVRLTNPAGKPTASVKPTSGTIPFSVRFSPDGQKIGLSFADNDHIDVIQAGDLSPLYSPDVTGISGGDLHSLAWSPDSTWLMAGGSAEKIRRWSKAGQGPYDDAPRKKGDVVMDLAALPDGGLLFSLGDGGWGVYGQNGRPVRKVAPVIAEFREMRLRLTPDGKTVRFAYSQGGHDLAAFEVEALQLLPGKNTPLDLVSPEDFGPGIKITKWHDERQPQLNETALPIEASEMSRTVSVSPDGSVFVVGTDRGEHAFDPQGQIRWEFTTPAPVQAVNVSSDDRLVVVASADGTILWQRASDGAPLLTLFPHADRKRWVAFTRSGYYETSADGESLIGFLENATADKLPNFVPAARYRARFHRPDIVARILDTLDEDEAVKQANAARKAVVGKKGAKK